MININTYGLEASKEYLDLIKKSPVPDFVSYHEDISKIISNTEPFQKYPKMIVIGNGGSISSFDVFLRSLKGNGKKVFILNTNDPDLINNLKKEFTPSNTIIICISKSGETISALEAVLQFQQYPVIAITSVKENPLRSIAGKLGWTIIDHPEIGGRFSAFTTSALVPSALFGLPLDKIVNGAQAMYEKCGLSTEPSSNPAWILASVLSMSNKIGKNEIFMPVYSYYLETFIPLVTQLIHETLGKDGKGFSVIAALAPESQHHTNQRFFGGPKNMIGVFLSVNKLRDKELKTSIPDKLKDIPIRGGKLEELGEITLENALKFEAKATLRDAQDQKIPVASVEIEEINSNNIAELIALWHMTVYYLAILEGVNPFDQPQVERSKEISWQLRKLSHQQQVEK